MTTDELRRMLELAARACALEVKCAGENYNGLTLWVRDSSDCPWFPWAPNTDDGDSARMRTALRMNVIWSDTAVHCLSSLGVAVESFADHNNDRDAALLLCALRVAAMIGEGME
jgi:hypothetical protein